MRLALLPHGMTKLANYAQNVNGYGRFWRQLTPVRRRGGKKFGHVRPWFDRWTLRRESKVVVPGDQIAEIASDGTGHGGRIVKTGQLASKPCACRLVILLTAWPGRHLAGPLFHNCHCPHPFCAGHCQRGAPQRLPATSLPEARGNIHMQVAGAAVRPVMALAIPPVFRVRIRAREDRRHADHRHRQRPPNRADYF